MKKGLSFLLLLLFTIFIIGCKPEQVRIQLIGGKDIIIDVFDNYIEKGAVISKGEVIITGDVDTSKVGNYVIRYENEDGSTFVERTVRIEDRVEPVININGDEEVFVFLGDEYKELGATASDNYDGIVNVIMTSNLDVSKEGVYKIKYSAEDSSGNESDQLRTVRVISPEPKLTLNGNSELTIFVMDEYIEEGAYAYDALGNELEVTIEGGVDYYTMGSYDIKYHVTDNYGNYAEKVRTVNVGRIVEREYSGFSKVIALSDGGYLVYNRDYPTLTKIKDGGEIFNKTRSELGVKASFGSSVIEDRENNIVISYGDTSNCAYLQKMDKHGEEIWTWKRMKTDALHINYIEESDIGYFYLGHNYVGNDNDSSLIYGLLDKDGNFKWEKSYKNDQNTSVNDLVYYNEKLYLSLHLYGTGIATQLGVTITNDGELQEFAVEDDWIYNMSVSPELGVIGLGGYTINTIDENFNLNNVVDLPDSYRPNKFSQVDNGTYLLLNDFGVYNISSSGDIIFKKEFPDQIDIYVGMSVNEKNLIVEYLERSASGASIYLFENVFN